MPDLELAVVDGVATLTMNGPETRSSRGGEGAPVSAIVHSTDPAECPAPPGRRSREPHGRGGARAGIGRRTKMRFESRLAWIRTALSIVLLLAGAALGCAPPGEEDAPEAATDTPAEPGDDEAAVRALAEAWDPTFMMEDADAMAALFTEDAVRLPANEPIIAGREAIRADFVEVFDGTSYETSNPVEAIGVADDWAWVYGTFEDVETDEESGETSEDAGKWLSILRRTDEGWKYEVDMWNRNAPLPAEAIEEISGAELPPAEAVTEGPAEEVEAVRAVLDSWAAAQDAGDVDALVAPYAEDAVVLNEDGPEIVGREAIRADLEAEAASLEASDSVATYDVIEVDGDWAWARGHFETTVTPESGETLTLVGKWLNILRRTDDGWKIEVAIWNRNAPAPAV